MPKVTSAVSPWGSSAHSAAVLAVTDHRLEDRHPEAFEEGHRLGGHPGLGDVSARLAAEHEKMQVHQGLDARPGRHDQ